MRISDWSSDVCSSDLAANDVVRRLIAAIDDTATSTCVLAERALLAALGADCHSPVAALATLDTRLRIEAALFSNDGRETVTGAIEGAPDDATIGARLARSDSIAHSGCRELPDFTPSCHLPHRSLDPGGGSLAG